jgi:D-xylose 1-dehydrogenase (NADP+, D-xylono-1,5-lactone-forming)
MAKKLKWGIAGCGMFAEKTFIPTFLQLRKSILSSVFSHNLNRAKQISSSFLIKNSFDDYDEFLKSDIDAVYIASINSDHYEQVIKAARAGKNILCEKPVAIDSVQAEEMVKICEENNVELAVNYVYRFHPNILKAKELLRNQLLGKLTLINASFNIDLPPGNNFRYEKKLSGGGALRDLGTHMIDLLRFLGGEIESIQGVVDNVIYKSEVDDFSAGILRFKESGYGYFNVSYNNKKAFNRLEILGHKGAISIDSLIGSRALSSKLTILLEGEARKAFRKRGNKLLNLLKSVQKSFIKGEKPPVTGYDGYINLKLMEELERNAK